MSDIGVYQINDPEEAATTQRHWDAKYQKDINGQYAAARGGTVIYDKDTGKATFIGTNITSPCMNVFGFNDETLRVDTKSAPQ